MQVLCPANRESAFCCPRSRAPPPEPIAPPRVETWAMQNDAADTVQLVAPGLRVEGRFVVQAMAGSGGMGVVYRADDVVTGEAVALKVLTGGQRFES